MRAAKRLSNRISPRAKMKEMPRKVLADKTNQQGRKILEEKLKKIQSLDEGTMTRRSKRVLLLSNETNQQVMDKQSLDSSKEIEGKICTKRKENAVEPIKDLEMENVKKEESVKKEVLEEKLKEEVMEVTEEITEETKEVFKKEEKKWDPLDRLSEYEKIRLENIRQVSTFAVALSAHAMHIGSHLLLLTFPPDQIFVHLPTIFSQNSERGTFCRA